MPTAPSSSPTATGTAANAAAAPKLRILCPTTTPTDAEAAALLKVVWTSRHFGVGLELGRPCPFSDPRSLAQLQVIPPPPSSGNGGTSSSSSPPTVTCPFEENALAEAVASLSAGGSSMSAIQKIVVEEWCEWERTVLRPLLHEDDAKKLAKRFEQAVSHLEHALSGSPHLLEHSETLADIVVASTLTQLVEKQQQTAGSAGSSALPDRVALYLRTHSPAFAAARAETAKRIGKLDLDHDPDDVSMFGVLAQVFGTAVRNAFGPSAVPTKNFVTKCQNPKHGDYQCNAAMGVFAVLKKSATAGSDYQSPQQVAHAIVTALGENHPVVMGVEVNGPGFVLCRIRPAFLEQHINGLLHDNAGKLPFPPEPRQVCVVDFSSPNIAKEMHVGHLRSTIIGEAVCRILEAVGHEVHRVNHVGDWGTQFGMLIQYLTEEYPAVANHDSDTGDATADAAAVAELPNITDLTVFYKSAKERFDSDEDFKEKSRINVVKLQAGDPQCRRIWKLLCDISRGEFQKVYQRLDVTTEEFGESFYNGRIKPVIADFAKAGLLQAEEGGAKVVFCDKFQVPLMLQKSDGGYGYDSTDMAALKYRLFELKADRIICITDYSQGDHFQMVYSAGRAIGWIDRNQRLEHIGFGTVMGEDGKRFKTRSGDTVRLVDLLDEAVNRMEASLTQRVADNKANITLEEVHGVAEDIGYGAIKYYDLRRNPTSNYKFSYDMMLDTKGDTAVYLLYARVRLESIMTKAKAEHNVDVQDLLEKQEPIVLGHDSERSLALSLHVFADVIETTLEDLYPCHVCEYVYRLSNSCSDFVTQCKVLGSPEMKSRLLLCYVTAQAMDQCFDLLGIRQVKRF